MTSPATPVGASPEDLARVRFNAEGLVPAIIQEQGTGQVLMLGWMNEAALKETLESGRTVFWSRSRQSRWRKGDTSGDRQWAREVWYDCDGDTLLVIVEQEGAGSCHTGAHSCFFRRLGAGPERAQNAGAQGSGAQGSGGLTPSGPQADPNGHIDSTKGGR